MIAPLALQIFKSYMVQDLYQSKHCSTYGINKIAVVKLKILRIIVFKFSEITMDHFDLGSRIKYVQIINFIICQFYFLIASIILSSFSYGSFVWTGLSMSRQRLPDVGATGYRK